MSSSADALDPDALFEANGDPPQRGHDDDKDAHASKECP